MNAWWPLLITLAIQAAAAMALLTIPAMAPEMAKAVGLPASHAGLYIALAYAAALLSSLSAGSAVIRYGAIRVSQICLLLCGTGLLLCAWGTLPALVLGALFIGMGYGPITPASSHLLAKTTPAHQMALVFSLKQTGVPLGGMLAGAVVPTMVLLAGWRGALVASACVGGVLVLVSQVGRGHLDGDRDRVQTLRLGTLSEPIRLVWGHAALSTLALCSFAFSMAQLSLTTYLVTYLYSQFAYTLVAAGLVLTVCQLGGVVGRIVWGWVADRSLGASGTLMVLGGLIATCALITAALPAQVPALALMALLAVFGASAIGWNGVYLAEVARQAPPGQAGVATGGTLAFTYLGVVIGPPLFGWLSEITHSYRAGFALLALPVGLALWALLRQRARNRPSTSTLVT